MALAGHFWFLFLTLWLYVVAVCLAITGFAALAGPLASIVLIGLFIAFGNTSSGGAVPARCSTAFFSAHWTRCCRRGPRAVHAARRPVLLATAE
jgi:hypothetical protein